MFFFPKNPHIFDSFESLAEKVKKGGDLLSKVSANSIKTNSYATKARKLELQADDICHKLFAETDKTFMTPIDREDIHVLAQSLDTIIDHTENVISNLSVYRIKRKRAEFDAFSTCISDATLHVFRLIRLLRYQSRAVTHMQKVIVKIHTIENNGDKLMKKALSSLFTNTNQPVMLIKWKDIFGELETILDECEHTADIVSAIIVKNY